MIAILQDNEKEMWKNESQNTSIYTQNYTIDTDVNPIDDYI